MTTKHQCVARAYIELEVINNKKEDKDIYLCFTLQGFLKLLQLGNKPLIRSHLRSFTSNKRQGTFKAHLILLHEICNNDCHTEHFEKDELARNKKNVMLCNMTFMN